MGENIKKWFIANRLIIYLCCAPMGAMCIAVSLEDHFPLMNRWSNFAMGYLVLLAIFLSFFTVSLIGELLLGQVTTRSIISNLSEVFLAIPAFALGAVFYIAIIAVIAVILLTILQIMMKLFTWAWA